MMWFAYVNSYVSENTIKIYGKTKNFKEKSIQIYF